MRVLHVLPSVDPCAGGPRENVRQLGCRMLELGHSWEVVSLDAPEELYVSEFPLVVHALGPSRGKYRYNRNLIPWLKTNAKRYDAVIVNGIWQFHSYGAWVALREQAVPYFVFTHGMLDPWFKREFPLKHFKKWAYWPWADYRVLRDANAVLFTTEEERRLAKMSFWLYRATEIVVPYGTRQPPSDQQQLCERFFSTFPMLEGKRLILFLGRIHEKKGCDLLVRAFAEVATLDPNLQLVVAGPDQSGWVEKLKSMSFELGIAARVTWPGMLNGDLKWGAYYAADAFILPSHQENFGISVVEALACGVPVLISDKVNIWREIESDGCGLVQSDSLSGTVNNLSTWLALTDDERASMRARALKTFATRFAIEAMADFILRVVAGQLDHSNKKAVASS